MSHCKRLTHEQRCQIDVLKNSGQWQRAMAKAQQASGAPAADFTVSTRVNNKGADQVTAATARLLPPIAMR